MTSGEVPQKFLTDEASCHYPDLVNASDWLKQIFLAARPVRSTTQIRVVTRHQQGISVLVPQTVYMTPGQLSHRSEFTPVPSNGPTFVI